MKGFKSHCLVLLEKARERKRERESKREGEMGGRRELAF